MTGETDPQYDRSLYAYDLPSEMIAQTPSEPRDSSKLMVLQRETGEIEHAIFRQVGDFLRKGDLLVLNDTKVFPARTFGSRHTGGHVEALFLRDLGRGKWEAMVRCNGNPRPGEFLMLADGRLSVRLLRTDGGGVWTVSLPRNVDLLGLLEGAGRMPLPPYIKRGRDGSLDALDRERYQTVYARHAGAVAAPTAGLHFTDALLGELEAGGIGRTEVTLHVGAGTFQPVKEQDIRRHRMHEEFYSIGSHAVARINEARKAGGRIVAIGTTACRTLEAAAAPDGLRAREGWTDLYIYPPYEFRMTDALLTNFHLPGSTLLLLVAAFAGRERILAAYEEAKRKGYRFYSYGDAMLIV